MCASGQHSWSSNAVGMVRPIGETNWTCSAQRGRALVRTDPGNGVGWGMHGRWTSGHAYTLNVVQTADPGPGRWGLAGLVPTRRAAGTRRLRAMGLDAYQRRPVGTDATTNGIR